MDTLETMYLETIEALSELNAHLENDLKLLSGGYIDNPGSRPTTEPKLSKLVVAYHNITSFSYYRNYILQNEFHTKCCDILILAETQTISSDVPHLPGFELIYRCDDAIIRASRGILVYSKPSRRVYSFKPAMNWVEDTFHSTIVTFEMGNCKFITGYRSASAPAELLFGQIRKAIDNEITKRTWLIGDFNFDAMAPHDPLRAFMSRYSFNNQLPATLITSNLGAQVDVIYSNVSTSCNAYQCFFSYHKAVYALMDGCTELFQPQALMVPNDSISKRRAKRKKRVKNTEFNVDSKGVETNHGYVKREDK